MNSSAVGEGWSIPAVLDVVTEVAPEREMVVCGPLRRTFAEVAERTSRLAAYLVGRGLGVERERSELAPWECGQSRLAILMSNGAEYLEAMVGSYRARVVPYNVNHQYRAAEIADLVESIGADAVVYHRRFGPRLADLPRLGERVLLEVDDGSTETSLPGSLPFEEATSAALMGDGGPQLPAPSPDDLYMVCTGGTTGTPKGVLWRQADIYVAGMGGADGATTATIAEAARTPVGIFFAAPPMMHGAAQWTAFSAVLAGGTVVLHDDARRFDAATMLQTAEQERVTVMSIVGDAFARPLVDELRRGSYDLSALGILGTGGAATNPENKRALLDLMPHLVIVDGYGASETGAAGYASSTRGNQTREFAPAAGTAVVDEAMTRFLSPGEDETGWAARTGHIPLGYLGDPEKTRRTFVEVEGQRVSVPGDRARYDDEGRIVMLGRDSLVINTGGEKVFVEEVEEAIRRHPDVADALVVGRPDERFGQAVVALVEPRPGVAITPVEIRDWAAGHVARYKAPRAVRLCDRIARFPTGKADYEWARQAALDAEAATEG